MNKRYIFEYVSGTKGDMVVRFLNELEPNIDPEQSNRTSPASIGCTNWLKLIDPEELTLERFEEVLSINPFEYLPAHQLWVCYDQRYMDLVEKYNYEIISLKFEPKHYVTAAVERILKTHTGDYRQTESVIGQINSRFSKDKSNIEVKRKNALRRLEMGPARMFARQYDLQNLFNIMTENRTLLHYEDLFCTDAPFPNLPEREDEWLMLVQQSWCETDKCGYRNFEVPEGWEKYSFVPDQRTQKILDNIEVLIDGKTI